jgi:hypothetical protein
MVDRNSFVILSQLNSNHKNNNHSQQLALPLELPQKPKIFRQKAQIKSSPGISPRERDRYRVLMGDRILGDRLNLDEALKLAKEG